MSEAVQVAFISGFFNVFCVLIGILFRDEN
uniref:Uncharacterized protein n=1 Tax=virus sp. ctBS918 TaxID=2825807 RepID=A0A8S5RP06_9VIRU|nr:MAG TPA: hypothetical protein [virus sp. ctBS918]